MERSKYELTEKGHVVGCPCCEAPVDETLGKLRKLIPPERQRRVDALKARRKTIRVRLQD